MAAVVANKVKRQRSSRANQRAPPGGIQLEIDEHGRLREVVDVKARARAKARAAKMKPNPNAEYYQKVGGEQVFLGGEVYQKGGGMDMKRRWEGIESQHFIL